MVRNQIDMFTDLSVCYNFEGYIMMLSLAYNGRGKGFTVSLMNTIYT